MANLTREIEADASTSDGCSQSMTTKIKSRNQHYEYTRNGIRSIAEERYYHVKIRGNSTMKVTSAAAIHKENIKTTLLHVRQARGQTILETNFRIPSESQTLFSTQDLRLLLKNASYEEFRFGDEPSGFLTRMDHVSEEFAQILLHTWKTYNHSMPKKITFQSCIFTPAEMKVFSKVLALGEESKSLKTGVEAVHFDSVTFEDPPYYQRDSKGNWYHHVEAKRAIDFLAEALEYNTSLKSLAINHSSVKLVTSLIGHPQLRKLNIHGALRPETCEKLKDLLEAPSCCIEELHIGDNENSLSATAISFVANISRRYPNLESLTVLWHVHASQYSVIQFILQSLSKFPNLKILRLPNSIKPLQLMDTNQLKYQLPPGLSKKLRVLDLCRPFRNLKRPRNQISSDQNTTVIKLLDSFPNLCDLGEGYNFKAVQKGILDTDLVHILDMNRSIPEAARKQLVSIGPSLWATVLAKVTKDPYMKHSTLRQASILFELVRGTAVAGRPF